MVCGRPLTGGLDTWFQTLIVSSEKGKSDKAGAVLSGWKDLPLELLVRIVSLADDPRMVIVASGVCTGWRDALCLGTTNLSFSWCNLNMNNLVQSLTPKFTKIEVLSLRQNRPQLEDGAVEAVANNCHELKDLDLSRSFRLSDRSLYALSDGCPHLTRLNISGCSNFSESALAIGQNCNQLQSLNLGWCESITDKGVVCLASGCPNLRALDLCGCILITDESVIALANGCPRLKSLGLYYCQNITDKAMYSLANSRVTSKRGPTVRKSTEEKEGLANLNISQCTALTPPAVQALCDSFPGLHTCPERHSLIISGCLSLTSVHCHCAVHAHRAGRAMMSTYHAY
ncbi:F-box protein SKP2A-like protein [Carex littledalei]|uniref:F-box protein SKP2A-like protein n=1 Tax=Carex littledalei TaxID=544730 RepID=A0A833V918_9POAL|nr:F-box protein SKP2A-like protein [Carex littledalei]